MLIIIDINVVTIVWNIIRSSYEITMSIVYILHDSSYQIIMVYIHLTNIAGSGDMQQAITPKDTLDNCGHLRLLQS